MSSVYTNRHVFFDIAKDALDQQRAAMEQFNSPKEGGGYIRRSDPHRTAFKQSMIGITFCCCYLEALMWQLGTLKLGSQYEDRVGYKKKLLALGVTDKTLLAQADHLSTVRRELMHEKAEDLEKAASARIFFGQTEAEKALAFVTVIRDVLEPELKQLKSTSRGKP